MFTKNVVKKGLAAAALCAALGSTAVAFPATASAATPAPAPAPAAPAAAAGGGGSVNANLNVNFDVLGIMKQIGEWIKTAQNRPGFVNDLKEKTFFAAGQKYNVVVHNLNVPHNPNALEGVKAYASADYDGGRYGIWVFEKGVFKNLGDLSNDTWAFRGNLAGRSSNDGKWGGDLAFNPIGQSSPTLPPGAENPAG
ncbi:stress protein [Streptomyces sp. NPDC015125]|uniref:stress protein n=1 Tax=Streptomyces sp. NPDC015125 TaxID=3364938 RepID=UPI0036FF4696